MLSGPKLSIAIPASVVADTPHLREKTAKLGLIGRAAAIFRVNEIIIYADKRKARQPGETALIVTLLRYMDTPQYLRKKLFKLKPELRYAGILPPLRTPHHPTNRKMRALRVDQYREGVTTGKTRHGTLVDIGVETPALIRNQQLPLGKRLTVQITDLAEQVEVALARQDAIGEYWGYVVNDDRWTIEKLIHNRSFKLMIATSKYGAPWTKVKQVVAKKWGTAKTILVAFGAPTHGLFDIVQKEKLEDLVTFVVNTIPEQGTKTIRTEEAIVASLAIFNTFSRKGGS